MRVGELFAGYGGLGMGLTMALPEAHPVWVSEIEPAASRVLAHHWPGAPNLGDITTIDWTTVPPVDVLTGGFPCQDVSTAGLRAGIRPGTRSGLWAHMALAIRHLQPVLVVIENVRGLLSADAHSNMERDCWCVGDQRESPLRALGAVLGDLSELGYDAQWATVPASAVGAPHRRERVFILAHPARHPGSGGGDEAVEHDGHRPPGRNGSSVPHKPDRGPDGTGPHPAPHPHGTGLEGRPTLQLARQRRPRPDGVGPVALLKTPTAQLAINGGAQHPGKRKAGGHGPTLADEVEHLLPTPNTMDALGPRSAEALARARTVGGCANLKDVAPGRWGDYAPAIARWEHALGWAAPAPTDGRNRLSPEFVEWMMGLPPGHVTGLGLTRAQALRLLGNGVVPQQAAHAITRLLAVP